MKRAAVIAFTRTGAALGARLMQQMKEWKTELFVPERIRAEGKKRDKAEEKTEQDDLQGIELHPLSPDSRTWLKVNWNVYQGFVFVSAVGIAVRLIAPCLKDKLTDPAVVALDETARFSIPLASGHVGGANRLAEMIAERLGAVPVITTATDVEDKFAVDVFAERNGIHLRAQDRFAARDISAAILEGKPVGFCCEYEINGEVPEELTMTDKVGTVESETGGPERNKRFSHRIEIRKTDIPETAELYGNMEKGGTVLRLIPHDVILGIGCKKGISAERIMEAIRDACRNCGISADRLKAVASIDLKAEEPGIRESAGKLALPFWTFPAESLSQIRSVSRESEFVRSVAGIGNVCERAAVYGALYGEAGGTGICGGAADAQNEIEILLPKTIYEGITLAAVRKKWSVRFE